MDPKTVMSFSDAFTYLSGGYAIKRIGWLGYWVKDGNDLVMHCKDGSIVRLSEGCDPILTLGSVAAKDWMIVYDSLRAELDEIHKSGIFKPKPTEGS